MRGSLAFMCWSVVAGRKAEERVASRSGCMASHASGD